MNLNNFESKQFKYLCFSNVHIAHYSTFDIIKEENDRFGLKTLKIWKMGKFPLKQKNYLNQWFIYSVYFNIYVYIIHRIVY